MGGYEKETFDALPGKDDTCEACPNREKNGEGQLKRRVPNSNSHFCCLKQPKNSGNPRYVYRRVPLDGVK